MHKLLIKAFLIILFPIICFIPANTYAHSPVKNKSTLKQNIISKEVKPHEENIATVEDKLMNSFENYQDFEDSTNPVNQFFNLFGVGGFADQRLKSSSFKLWDTFEKEMSNQIGNQRLNGSDINNTFNDSLNNLGK